MGRLIVLLALLATARDALAVSAKCTKDSKIEGVAAATAKYSCGISNTEAGLEEIVIDNGENDNNCNPSARDDNLRKIVKPETSSNSNCNCKVGPFFGITLLSFVAATPQDCTASECLRMHTESTNLKERAEAGEQFSKDAIYIIETSHKAQFDNGDNWKYTQYTDHAPSGAVLQPFAKKAQAAQITVEISTQLKSIHVQRGLTVDPDPVIELSHVHEEEKRIDATREAFQKEMQDVKSLAEPQDGTRDSDKAARAIKIAAWYAERIQSEDKAREEQNGIRKKEELKFIASIVEPTLEQGEQDGTNDSDKAARATKIADWYADRIKTEHAAREGEKLDREKAEMEFLTSIVERTREQGEQDGTNDSDEAARAIKIAGWYAERIKIDDETRESEKVLRKTKMLMGLKESLNLENSAGSQLLVELKMKFTYFKSILSELKDLDRIVEMSEVTDLIDQVNTFYLRVKEVISEIGSNVAHLQALNLIDDGDRSDEWKEACETLKNDWKFQLLVVDNLDLMLTSLAELKHYVFSASEARAETAKESHDQIGLAYMKNHLLEDKMKILFFEYEKNNKGSTKLKEMVAEELKNLT